MILLKQLERSAEYLGEQSCRLFHGRGHCFEGLEFINIDWFEPVIWVVVYGDHAAQLDQLKQQIITFSDAHDQVKAIVLQQRLRGKAYCETVYGDLPDLCYAVENQLRYWLDFSSSQNIGFFMDAKPGREWLAAQVSGKRALNLFAYTCSFSVAALHAGADKVVNIDMSRSAIKTGQRNHALNNLDCSRAVFLPHDIFRSTRKLEQLGPYDIIVIDPPSRQKGSFEAEKDYARLLRKLKPMLAESCHVLACLNAPYLDEQFLVDVFNENLPSLQFQERLPQRQDFPEKDLQKCLKMMIFRQ